VELIDLPDFGPEHAARVTGGQPDAYGTDHLGIEWREKSAHVGLVDGERLVGHAGWVPSGVRTADGQQLAVVGLGSVMIHPDYRGRGLGAQLVAGAMERMGAGGGTLAMLFCRAERLAFYGRLGWVPVTDPVTVGQSGGAIVMPLHTCWTSLAGGGDLPAGALHLEGLPF
jgi:GNAT superfamily N-acetyltransferase